MAAKPLDKAISSAIVTDWRLGQMSQSQISDKHGVSKGAVNKLCKGVDQDVAPIVTAGIEYRRALQAQDDRIVTAVEETVTIISKRLEYLAKMALENVAQAMAADCEDQTDYRHRSATINAAKENLVGKAPAVAVQVNNEVSIPLMSQDDLRSYANKKLEGK